MAQKRRTGGRVTDPKEVKAHEPPPRTAGHKLWVRVVAAVAIFMLIATLMIGLIDVFL